MRPPTASANDNNNHAPSSDRSNASNCDPNFDRIARPYNLLEHITFGPALQRTRLRFLPLLHQHRRALILGDGDGRFTAALLARYPHLHADAVDLSPAMLTLLSRRARRSHPTATSRLRTHQANALRFTPDPGTRYDLVATHFFLDCLTSAELRTLCTRLRPHLAPDARWLVSDFRIPSGALQLPARALIRSLYLGFRLLTGLRTTNLPDHAAAFADLGLVRTARVLSLRGILTAEMWQLPGAHASSENAQASSEK